MDADGGAGEEVTDFLQRIRELGDKRDREDTERARQLEAEILAGREARRARRDERARSISPQKDSPFLTPQNPLVLSPTDGADDVAPPPTAESSGTSPAAALEKLTGKLHEATTTTQTTTTTTTTSEAPAATPANEPPQQARPVSSWQRRERPKSISHSSLLSRKALVDEAAAGDRKEIAERLGQKQPEWFRQTTERLAASPALRKSDGEDPIGQAPKKELPGMRADEDPVKRPDSAQSVLGRTDEPEANAWNTAETTRTGFRTRSPSVHGGRFELTPKDTTRPMPMSPSQSRIDDDPNSQRGPSPTKWTGGFVQSAMLKRESSVNKRWSAQQDAAGASGVTPRNTFTTRPRPKSFHQSMASRESLRSQVSSDTASGTQGTDEKSAGSEEPTATDLSSRGRAMSTSSFRSDVSGGPRRGLSTKRDSTPPPGSPAAKQWEQKRWSPTKSSWLESALLKGSEVQTPAKPLSKPLDKAPVLRPTPSVPATPPASIKPPVTLKPTTPLMKPSEKVLEKAEKLEAGAVTPPKPDKLTLARSAFESPQTYRRPLSPDKGLSSAESSPRLSRTLTGSPEKPVEVKRLMGAHFGPRSDTRSPSPEKKDINMGKLDIGSPTAKSVADLRAGLRPRAMTASNDNKEPLPFQDAMQRLRSTKVEKPKARDELKEVIQQGKAHLNPTSGPQKTVRVDPLKESVLSAKGSLRSSREIPPAGIAVLQKKLAEKDKKSELPPEKPFLKARSMTFPKAADLNAEKPKLEPVEKPVMPLKSNSFPKADVATEKPKIGGGVGKVASLADRLNPGLAGLMMKGPPAPGASAGNTAGPSKPSAPIVIKQSEPTEPSGPLKHMTKQRARGPKRRAPTTVITDGPMPKAAITKPVKNVSREESTATRNFSYTMDKPLDVPDLKAAPAPRPLPVPPKRAEQAPKEETETDLSRQFSFTADKPLSVVPRESIDAVIKPEEPKAKPAPPAKSPLLRGNSTSSVTSLKENDENIRVRSQTPPLVRKPSTEVLLKKPSQTSLRAPSPVQSKLQATTEEEDDDSSIVATPVSRSPVLQGRENTDPLGISNGPVPPRVSLSPLREPVPARGLPSIPPPSPTPSTPSRIGLENVQILSEFFTEPSFVAPKIEFDIMSIIRSKPSTEKRRVRTVRIDVSVIHENGRLTRVSAEHEHVFYDEAMYLCLHTFESFPGQHEAEVYLWTGSKVSPAAVDDVQLFARRVANEHDGRMIHIQQGRETSYFFEAIGGILVTLRGPHKDSPAASNFLLCGRSTIGGVAFDEVNMEFAGLCSGFCYLLRHNGKMFLWKGRGTTPEEIGVAKIVGFEIGQDEIKECAEGQETPEFLSALGGPAHRFSAEYWSQRPHCRQYGTRLFRIDLASPNAVTEIYPFAQSDLDPAHIYVADAYFEFYIVLGAQAQDKRSEFQTALQFAQEYSMLAVSHEDRPMIPVVSVILGGAPREFKALFRTWEDQRCPTKWTPTRKPSLRIVGVQEAMEALSV